MSDNYHHGNLRNALIEEGIRMINAGGEDSLSLRKLAVNCGVSNAAPYAHFKNKDEMISAMKEYVSGKFTDYLLQAIENISDTEIEQKILVLGNAYVKFFMKNPEYFTFLFSRGHIHLCLDLESKAENNFKPYEILKELCLKYFANTNPKLTDYEKEQEIIRIWASVQGLTSIVFMENVKWSHNWEEEISKLLK